MKFRVSAEGLSFAVCGPGCRVYAWGAGVGRMLKSETCILTSNSTARPTEVRGDPLAA